MACDEPASYRIFWPGKPPTYICEPHAEKGKAIANAIGCYVHFEPVDDDHAHICEQKGGRRE